MGHLYRRHRQGCDAGERPPEPVDQPAGGYRAFPLCMCHPSVFMRPFVICSRGAHCSTASAWRPRMTCTSPPPTASGTPSTPCRCIQTLTPVQTLTLTLSRVQKSTTCPLLALTPFSISAPVVWKTQLMVLQMDTSSCCGPHVLRQGVACCNLTGSLRCAVNLPVHQSRASPLACPFWCTRVAHEHTDKAHCSLRAEWRAASVRAGLRQLGAGSAAQGAGDRADRACDPQVKKPCSIHMPVPPCLRNAR